MEQPVNDKTKFPSILKRSSIGVAVTNEAELQEKSADEFLLELGAGGLATVTQRNINSLLYEKNYSVPHLALKSSVDLTQIYSYLKGFSHPTQAALGRLAGAFDVKEAEICNPNRNSIVPDSALVRTNLEAIQSHFRYLGSKFFIQTGVYKRHFDKCVSSGMLSYPQANRIACFAKLSVRELLSQDVSSRFPSDYDEAAVRRNLFSFFFERGITATSLANRSGIKAGSLFHFLKGHPFAHSKEKYAALAKALNVSIQELADPTRPETKPTEFVSLNLQYLLDQAGTYPTTYCTGFVDIRLVRKICSGQAVPNYQQTKGICDLFGMVPQEFLTQDLRSKKFVEYRDIEGRRRWRPMTYPAPCVQPR